MAAKCNGVLPHESLACTFAPAFSNTSSMAALVFFPAAQCSGGKVRMLVRLYLVLV